MLAVELVLLAVDALVGEDVRRAVDALVEGDVRLGGDLLEKVSREHLGGHRCCLRSRLCHFSHASRVALKLSDWACLV